MSRLSFDHSALRKAARLSTRFLDSSSTIFNFSLIANDKGKVDTAGES